MQPIAPQPRFKEGSIAEQPLSETPFAAQKGVSEAAQNLARALDWDREPATETERAARLQAGSDDVSHELQAEAEAPAEGADQAVDVIHADAEPAGPGTPATTEPAEPIAPTGGRVENAEEPEQVEPERAAKEPPAPTAAKAAPTEDVIPRKDEAPSLTIAEHQPEPPTLTPSNNDEPLKIQLVTQFKPWQIVFLLIAAGGILIALLAVILVLESTR